MTNKPYGRKRKIQVTMTLNPDLVAEMKRAARAEGVSVSHVVNRTLQAGIAQA